MRTNLLALLAQLVFLDDENITSIKDFESIENAKTL